MDTMRMLGYSRVSTREQADSGLGLDAQRARLDAEVERRGWTLTHISDDGYSAKNLNRPAILESLETLDCGDADGLMVAKLDRLSRSVLDFAGVMDRAHRNDWHLVVLDLGVDTTSPSGKMMATIMASFAEYERDLIGQRTKDALAQKRAQGYRLGRPVELPDGVRQRIRSERESGMTLQAIADGLTADGIPTARGGVWRRDTIRKVLLSLSADKPPEAG